MLVCYFCHSNNNCCYTKYCCNMMLCYKISEIVIVVVVCFKIDNKTYNWHKKNINYNKYNSIGNFKLNTLDKSTFMYLHVEDDDDNDFNRKFINKVNELITHMHVYTYTYLCTHTRCDQKTSHYFKFFQKVFIYLSITSLSPSKLPLQILYTYISVFSNLRNTFETRILLWPTAAVTIFLLSPQS